MWYSSNVYKGSQTGRTINFPTINLDPSVLPIDYKQGVFAAIVTYQDKHYYGALYFGPRLVLNETQNVLEIYLLDFDKEIYHERIDFQIKDFIRGVQNFPSMEEMQKQLEIDIQFVKEYFINNQTENS